MNQEIEVFVKILEKNFSNQVIDEFLLVKVEKEYPCNLEIVLEDPRSLLESCFSIWDISSRLLVQDKKNLTSNGKYVLRLRLLCCRLIYFIFQSQLKTEDVSPIFKNQGKETIKNVHYHDVPTLFQDSDIAQETLKMLVRCAQNCFEVEDTQRLCECLNLLASFEESFSISEYVLKNHQNLQLYLLMNQWILQHYANEDQQIPKSLIKKKFPQLLSLISSTNANPFPHEKDRIITLILIIVCKLMIASDENHLLGKELANFSLKTLQDYTHLLSNKEDLNQLFQKILIYSSIQQQSSTTSLQLYEKLTACSEDKLTEYLKLLVEVKLKLSKDDMDLLAKKIEFLTSQYDIDPEEFCAFVEELTLITGKNYCKGFFLAQFIESISNNAKFKAKKVDLVAMKLLRHWIDQIQTVQEDSINTESLQEHLQIILKSILKDRISSKKLHILEKSMIRLAKLLTLQKSYKLSFDFLENLIEFIRKDHASMLKEACILQIENCYYLKLPIGAKRAFETYDSLESDKEEFLYNVCKLKTLITIALTHPDQEAHQLTHDIPSFLGTMIESKNFDDKTFFLLVIELLQNNLGGGSRLQNQTVMLKEFFIVLRKGLEKVILNHEQQELEKSSFPLFKLFCVYLSHFEELFNQSRGEKNHFSESLIHESIGTTLEIGFLVLETFRIFCEKFVLTSDDSSKTRFLNPTWLVQQNELEYLDNFYWNLAIFVGYLNLDLNFALRFIFLSLKMKLMSIILNNLGIFGDFVGDNNSNNLEIDLFLQFCLDRTKEIYIEESMLLSLIKTLLLYVSNTLCLLKNKENNKSENLIVLKCLELNQALITNSDSNNSKAFSYLQYHCLVEFEYRLLVCPETTRMFLDDFCPQIDLDPQLFLVFADIANTLKQKQEYLLCLRAHVRASLKDNATPFLSVECYVELIENSQGIEDEICYLRQLLTFLDDNVQELKSKNTSQDVIQELEYLYAFCQNKNNAQEHNDEKRELYQVKSLLLEEIKEKINMFVIKDL